MSSTFGERLRDLRKEKNLLQSEFGEMFELSSSAIGAYERNEREPSYYHLLTFADFFNVSLDYLLGRSEERLTVEQFTAKDSFQFKELLNDRTVFIGSYELQGNDKKNIYNIACGLIFGFDSE